MSNGWPPQGFIDLWTIDYNWGVDSQGTDLVRFFSRD
jgi:hypothetical protein